MKNSYGEIKVDYEDVSNDLKNIIGMFYKVESNLKYCYNSKHKIKSYILIYKNKKIEFKLYATYYMDYIIDVENVKKELDREGYMDMKKWSLINKERLLGNIDIETLISKKLVLENPIDERPDKIK